MIYWPCIENQWACWKSCSLKTAFSICILFNIIWDVDSTKVARTLDDYTYNNQCLSDTCNRSNALQYCMWLTWWHRGERWKEILLYPSVIQLSHFIAQTEWQNLYYRPGVYKRNSFQAVIFFCLAKPKDNVCSHFKCILAGNVSIIYISAVQS